jgi:inosose dehydratase
VRDADYSGWIVVESDQSPHPAESAMVSGWYVQKVLQPIFARRVEQTARV